MFARAVVLGALLTTSAACITSTPGLARATADNPLVSIGAGKIEVGGGGFWHVWYVIDKRTQTCWMGNVTSSPASPPGGPAPSAAAPAASPDAH